MPKGLEMELISGPKTKKTTQDDAFEKFWMTYPKRPNDNKQEAYRQWKARLNGGESPYAMWAGAARYAEYCRQKIDDPQYIKKAATFLGRDRHYLLEWAVVKKDKAADFDRWLKGDGDDGIIDI